MLPSRPGVLVSNRPSSVSMLLLACRVSRAGLGGVHREGSGCPPSFGPTATLLASAASRVAARSECPRRSSSCDKPSPARSVPSCKLSVLTTAQRKRIKRVAVSEGRACNRNNRRCRGRLLGNQEPSVLCDEGCRNHGGSERLQSGTWSPPVAANA